MLYAINVLKTTFERSQYIDKELVGQEIEKIVRVQVSNRLSIVVN